MSNAGLWPWPDPTNHEIQMLRTKCRELEAANKTQAARIETLSRLLSGAEEAAIERSEQIKRLQAAFKTALSEINDLSEEAYNHMAGPFLPQGPSDYGITAADMEATDD